MGTKRLRKVCKILTEKRERDSRGRKNRNGVNKFTTIITDDIILAQNNQSDDYDEENKMNDDEILNEVSSSSSPESVQNIESKAPSHKNVKLRDGLTEREG